MIKHVEYTPVGVCTQKITFDLVDGYVHHVQFTGGCSGNTKGVAVLAEGLEARELARRLKGIPCQGANSCPHQLSLAIEQALGDCGEE
ncbi:MAG: TIGR03905 family TSCPD domain-containing protein [Oscillospiraceae bacterium]|nr:TIGR03905 family TSCPD domain-containing protein [Oscillospiraceae bacterium]